MAAKIRLTRPELKRQRDALERFERYLPMLKLKQQQLQLTVRDVQKDRSRARAAIKDARGRFEPYQAVLADVAGLDVRHLAEPAEIRTSTNNVAGVNIPVFEEAVFPPVTYSLFATPPWVDRALADLKALNTRLAEADVLRKQFEVLHRELVKIIQRVNLFEKVKIPEAREIIRVIRIRLGDQRTAGVGRAKIAKAKIAEETEAFGSSQDLTEANNGGLTAANGQQTQPS